MGSSPSPPALTPPNVTADEQQLLNLQSGTLSQQGSMIDQFNPYGSLNYTQTGDLTANIGGQNYSVPTFASSINYSPQQMQLLNQYTGAQGIAGSEGENILGNSYGMYSANPTAVIGNETSGLTGQMMGGYLQQMEPFFQNQTNQELTQLYNEGLTPGPTTNPNNPNTWNAFDNAMYGLQQSQGDTVAGAAAQFEPSAFGQATSLYTIPSTIGTSLESFGAPTSPGTQLTQTPGLGVGAADLGSITANYNQAALAEYQAQIAQQSALEQGGFGLLGTILGAGILKSDDNFKWFIKEVGSLPSGVRLYEFEYKDSPGKHIGVLSSEVRKVKPEAVIVINGVDYINYNLL